MADNLSLVILMQGGKGVQLFVCNSNTSVLSDPSLQDWPSTAGKASGQRDHRPVPPDCHSLRRQPWRGEQQPSLLNYWPDSSGSTNLKHFENIKLK